MKVAFFAPLSPMRGGVVDYSEEILPCLAHHCDIDVYTRDGLTPSNKALIERFCVHGHGEFLERDRQAPYDQVIYQLGCHSDHVPDYENLLKRPGLTVLHELNLGGIVGARTFGRGRPKDYVNAVLLNEGIMAAASVMWQFARTRRFPDYLAYDFNRLALTRSLGIIVHNQFMYRQVVERLSRWRTMRPVYQVPMGIRPSPEASVADVRRARQKLGLGEDAFVIGSFGVVHESKGVLAALNAFQRLLSRVPEAVYLLVGPVEARSVVETIQTMGLGDRVKLTGYVSMEDFYRYIAVTDLCVNLRLPRTGGTSATLLRLLSVGRPVIISNQAQFADIPDDVCLKAEVGDCAEDSVLAHMLDVAAHPDKARRIGERGRHYILQVHSLEKSARAYWEVIQDSLESRRRV
jgi:glycosyltransferase involved in cell wall biosynthesis